MSTPSCDAGECNVEHGGRYGMVCHGAQHDTVYQKRKLDERVKGVIYSRHPNPSNLVRQDVSITISSPMISFRTVLYSTSPSRKERGKRDNIIDVVSISPWELQMSICTDVL
jgi:hypothetical protein